MYKANWGLKRTCPMCRSPYYDLGRTVLECPSCGKEIEVVNLSKPRRGRKPGSINVTTNINTPKNAPQEQDKPKDEANSDLDIDNIEVESTDPALEEDDTFLIEEDNDIDPAVDVGIKPNEEKEG